MMLTDLLPTLKSLSRAEKLSVIRLLAADLEAEGDVLRHIAKGGSYPVWSPYESLEAAGTLQRMLDQAGAAS